MYSATTVSIQGENRVEDSFRKEWPSPVSDADGLRLGSVDFVITEKCSLKCKDCCNLMQFYSSPRNADLEQFQTAIRNLAAAIGGIDKLNVVGGEVFMNKRWADFVLALLDTFPTGDVVVLSNATILPVDADLEKIANPRVSFQLSDYSKQGVRQRMEEFTERLERHGFGYKVIHAEGWQDCAHMRDYGRPEAVNKQVFANCCVAGFYSFQDGRLYPCPFASNAAALGAIPEHLDEAVDCTAAVDPEEVRALLELNPPAACSWCPGRPADYKTNSRFSVVTPAVQTRTPLPYPKMR
ncbi:MAG: radical SAM protein [Propionibacteriaceae bacterium]|nr:radical SAM protein [Propionibacteriaceae bacterium]